MLEFLALFFQDIVRKMCQTLIDVNVRCFLIGFFKNTKNNLKNTLNSQKPSQFLSGNNSVFEEFFKIRRNLANISEFLKNQRNNIDEIF